MDYLDQEHLNRVKRFPGTRGGRESENPYIRTILKKGNMKKVTIEATNITPKQWANKKKEQEKKREKSMRDLYRLEYLR